MKNTNLAAAKVAAQTEINESLQIELANLLAELENGKTTLNDTRIALSGYDVEQLQVGTGSNKTTKKSLIEDVLKPFIPDHQSESDKIKLPTKSAIRNEAAKKVKFTYRDQTQSLSKLVQFIHQNKDLCSDITALLKVDNLPMSFISGKNLLNIWAEMDKLKIESYKLLHAAKTEELRVYKNQLLSSDGKLSRDEPKLPKFPQLYLIDSEGNNKHFHTFNAVVDALKFAGKNNK